MGFKDVAAVTALIVTGCFGILVVIRVDCERNSVWSCIKTLELSI